MNFGTLYHSRNFLFCLVNCFCVKLFIIILSYSFNVCRICSDDFISDIGDCVFSLFWGRLMWLEIYNIYDFFLKKQTLGMIFSMVFLFSIFSLLLLLLFSPFSYFTFNIFAFTFLNSTNLRYLFSNKRTLKLSISL